MGKNRSKNAYFSLALLNIRKIINAESPCVSRIFGTLWQGHKDSNSGHAVLETAALPTELYPFICYAGYYIIPKLICQAFYYPFLTFMRTTILSKGLDFLVFLCYTTLSKNFNATTENSNRNTFSQRASAW